MIRSMIKIESIMYIIIATNPVDGRFLVSSNEEKKRKSIIKARLSVLQYFDYIRRERVLKSYKYYR